MNLIKAYVTGFLVVFILIICGCKKESDTITHPIDLSKKVASYNSSFVQPWIGVMLSLIKHTSGYSPPVGSRAIGYTFLVNYECLVNGMPAYQSLQNYLNITSPLPKPDSNTIYHWPAAANAGLAEFLRLLFYNAGSADKHTIDSIETNFDHQFSMEIDSNSLKASVAFGKAVADSIFEWSKSDGGYLANLNNYPAEYTPPTGPDKWIPTPAPMNPSFNFKPALQPYWGSKRAFMAENVSGEALLSPPPVFSTDTSSEMYKAAKEVYDIGVALTTEQKAIAKFWSDELGSYSPPGHSLAICGEIIAVKNANLELATEALLKVGIAVSDAFINCFKTKYTYNLLRPVTYIQQHIDAGWNTYIGSPPFPEYASCHSTQSGASAEVLSSLFGENISYTDNSKDDVPLPARSFTAVHAFAQEAAISRLYGGVHYRFSCNLGYGKGIIIGQNINTRLPVKK